MAKTLEEVKTNINEVKQQVDQAPWLKQVLILAGGHFTVDMFAAFLAPILPLLMSEIGFSIVFAGFLASAVSFSSSLMQIVFGYLSDKVSGRIFVITGPLLAAVCFTTIGYWDTKWMILVVALAGGMGISQFHPLAAKMVHGISRENKGKAMSYFITGGSMGYSLGPLVITTIAAALGIRYLPIVIIPAAAVSLMIYLYSPAHVADVKKKESFDFRKNYKQVAKLSIYVSIGIVRSVVILSFNTFVPIWYAAKGLSLTEGGTAIFVLHFFGAIGVFVGGILSDRFNPTKLITFSFLLSAPMLYLFLHASEAYSLLVLGIAGIMIYSTVPAVITEAQATLPKKMGMVSSMVMGFSWGVGGLMVVVVGKIAEIYGILPTLEVLAFIPIIGSIFSLPLYFRRKKKA